MPQADVFMINKETMPFYVFNTVSATDENSDRDFLCILFFIYLKYVRFNVYVLREKRHYFTFKTCRTYVTSTLPEAANTVLNI